jgi:FeS assembly SUF system regulator
MLRLSKKADYGLIALMHLAAKESGRSASAKEIADAYGLPLPLLAKVLQKLAKGGFLGSVQGTNGGYRLAREADAISALEVIRAIDGPVFLTSCSSAGSECGQTGRCTVRAPLHVIREQILLLLAGTTISAMARDTGRRATGYVPVRSLS